MEQTVTNIKINKYILLFKFSKDIALWQHFNPQTWQVRSASLPQLAASYGCRTRLALISVAFYFWKLHFCFIYYKWCERVDIILLNKLCWSLQHAIDLVLQCSNIQRKKSHCNINFRVSLQKYVPMLVCPISDTLHTLASFLCCVVFILLLSGQQR